MTIKILQFVLGIFGPHFVEQYAYGKFISKKNKQITGNTETVSQGYGWRYIWDAAYDLGIVSVGYRMIVSNIPLSFWEGLGYLLFLLGITLRIWALRELGQFYDPGIAIKADHQIIQTGPYHTLRHPLHSGTILKIAGLAFFSPLWLGVPAVFASILLGLYLNRTEDRIHAQQFGSSFKPYYLKTWDIVDLIFWKSRLK